MFANYVTVALRSLWKNRIFAIVNLISLATGMTVFLLAQLYATYETSHDLFFDDAERIYAIQTHWNPGQGIALRNSIGTVQAIQPVLETFVPQADASARLKYSAHVVGQGDLRFSQPVRYADPAFFEIFGFDLLRGKVLGAESSLNEVVLTRTAAMRFFGTLDVIDEVLTLDNQHDVRVTGVIEDLPKNTHLRNPLFDIRFEMIGHHGFYRQTFNPTADSNWDSSSTNDHTYVRLARAQDLAAAQQGLDRLYRDALPDGMKVTVQKYTLKALPSLATWLWDATGLPVIATIRLLGILVLLVAALNYTNLAAAQAMGRAREVGLRKTLGALRGQLMTQFLTESVCLALLALLLATASVDLVLPFINQLADKSIGFTQIGAPLLLPALAAAALGVGLLAGIYPAYLIQKPKTVDLLKRESEKGRAGRLVRSGLLVVQFSASILMLVLVVVAFAQNRELERQAAIFDKNNVEVLSQINTPEANPVQDALRREVLAIPGVLDASYSNQVPFQNNNNNSGFSLRRGEDEDRAALQIVRIDEHFLNFYGIDLIAGRNISDQPTRLFDDGGRQYETVINAFSARRLGFDNPADAVGQTLYSGNGPSQWDIVGVVEDVHFMGLHNPMKPFIHYSRPDNVEYLSVKIAPQAGSDVRNQIDAVWRRLVPELPVERRSLNGYFNEVFQIMSRTNMVLAIFAGIAILLAITGLFSMTAFNAIRRAHEIALRRVVGASTTAVTRLLMWQFLRPVLLALGLALPLSFLGARYYLQIFPDPIDLGPGLFAVTAVLTIGIAMATIAYHAVRVAHTSPAAVLRVE